MYTYSVGGRSANTAATADHVAANLWNPSSNIVIYVKEIWVFKTVATADNHILYRNTARGTAGSTVTPTINSDNDRGLAPRSGALLDLAAFSVQPTVVALGLARANLPATIGAGFVWVFPGDGIRVAPSEGLAVATPTAVILQASDFTYIWRE